MPLLHPRGRVVSDPTPCPRGGRLSTGTPSLALHMEASEQVGGDFYLIPFGTPLYHLAVLG